jgi:hypothetical protein
MTAIMTTLLDTWRYTCPEHGDFDHVCNTFYCTIIPRCPVCGEEGNIPEDEQ